MIDNFKVWSDTSSRAKATLMPTFDLRGWDDLKEDEKTKIIRHLTGWSWFIDYSDRKIIVECIDRLNKSFKVHTYGKNLFNMGGPQTERFDDYTRETEKAAESDFYRILEREGADVVFELLSYYAERLIEKHHLKEGSVDMDQAFSKFDRFSNALNDIFTQFGLNMSLTRQSFVPKQEQVVQELVIEPTFNGLNDQKWEPVQSNFADAIKEYRKGTREAYSNAITHIVSAVQAFLQIKVRGKIGKGELSGLISEGIKNNLLPNDALSNKVIHGLESTLMQYRQKQGDAHPKTEYATEESVRLLLNVAAVFIQHCNK